MRLLPALACAVALAACKAAPPPPAPAAGPGARLLAVDTDPPGAEVTVDGELRGQTPLKLALDPGKYKVALRLSRYMPYETDVTMRFGEDERVSARLVASH